ncbi:MAG: hypothetical protein L0Y79_10850 [Chlorobi bacterium]|nr:hypothetical protein [Chlorobiota bacterium]MCI0715554.1 hypothetical protein [Chlorobiota bacterium]
MLKNFFYSALLVISLSSFSLTDVFSKNTDCENYEVTQTINGVTYIYTYTCDGTLINVREAEE